MGDTVAIRIDLGDPTELGELSERSGSLSVVKRTALKTKTDRLVGRSFAGFR
jgi:hypothetical protein